MPQEPLELIKNMQKESWSLFAPLEIFTTIPAARLVNFVEITPNATVLDVGCGTGVVAITAARLGAKVFGLDLTPKLLEKAERNAAIAGVDVAFQEGDVEALPYSDASFDIVLSQFGHMFAPRAKIALNEMLRVLKPGGKIAFSTWPPEHFVGRMFSLVSQYTPPPPVAIDPPPQWGDPNIVRERLGDRVKDLLFDRDVMLFPCLSIPHYREGMEQTLGPVAKFVKDEKTSSERLQKFRQEFEKIIGYYFSKNYVKQHYLMTKATRLA